MRLRNIKGSRDVIAESEFVVHEFREAKGKWAEIFENANPIRIEVGMGKGQFIYELARRNPDINYIGIEKFSSVLLRAIQKMEKEPLPNLKFIRMEAEWITDVFEKDEVDRIYLNFSDPWPKDRHAKRRLESRQFLERYDSFLKKDGIIEFKTDNHDLFMFSLDEVKEAKWNLDEVTYDLHNDEVMNENNIMTEYEERFSSMGNPIYKYIISRN
ncbi:MAG: tRNA (guanosine(46)-N7)-methyltransferase TrmB [Lachnospiraceae bacterium]|nr:tRNA (guanosine(46)-N7)-methyltransferase TrmB [Lachnospiraceae bacterium]